MNRQYDAGHNESEDQGFDHEPLGFYDRPVDNVIGRRHEGTQLSESPRGAARPGFSHGRSNPNYEVPGRDYSNRGYQGEGYFGQSYAGAYPNMPYGTTNTSRFERGFNFDLFRERGGRGWWPKTRDEVARWFGDEEAERRRQRDEYQEAMSSNRGKGPRNYQRSDERIKDDVSDLLWDSDEVDASDMEVKVDSGEVTLAGTVPSRYQKRKAADLAESVWGVTDVMNLIRIEGRELTSGAEKTDRPPQRSINMSDTERSTSVASGG